LRSVISHVLFSVLKSFKFYSPSRRCCAQCFLRHIHSISICLIYLCTYIFRVYFLCLTQVMYVLYDLEGHSQCFSIKLVQPGAHLELYKRKAVELQIASTFCHTFAYSASLAYNCYCSAFLSNSYLLRVGSGGRPESESRRRVGVGLTEYTEEGNG